MHPPRSTKPPTAALIAAVAALLLAAPARAQDPLPAPPPPAVASQIQSDTLPLGFKDFQGAHVTLRIPTALHRPANAFRLYGFRPLTLRDRGRRKDLYRDAFLELSTRSRLSDRINAWDTLSRQLDWLTKPGSKLLFTQPPAALPAPSSPAIPSGFTSPAPNALPDPAAIARDLVQRANNTPGLAQFSALSGSLGDNLTQGSKLEPVIEALKLRALATDAAEQRLLQLGALTQNAADPALREGYLAAREEFVQLRQGVWPAVGAALRKHQGRLLLSTVKDIALSHLGLWAIFGYVGWQAAESTFSAEYQGQYAIALATIANTLAEAATTRPEYQPAALYAELVVNYQLTEALKQGQVMALRPAGGKDVAGWQIHCSDRCETLRRALTQP